MRRLNFKGDTLIEVMLALSVLSAILFISWAIVNRSSQISLAARKRVAMVNQLKEQAEILKDFYASNSNQVISKTFERTVPRLTVNNAPQDIPADPCGSRNAAGQIAPLNAFYFTSEATTENGVKPNVNGSAQEAVWVQMNEVGATPGGYIDFYIRACWQSGSGSQQKDDNSQLIVRLNK